MDKDTIRQQPWADWKVGFRGVKPEDGVDGVSMFTVPAVYYIDKRGIVATSSSTADALIFPRTGGSLELLVFMTSPGQFLLAVCHQSVDLPKGLHDPKVIATMPLNDATQETATEWARMVGQLCKSNGEVMTHAFL